MDKPVPPPQPAGDEAKPARRATRAKEPPPVSAPVSAPAPAAEAPASTGNAAESRPGTAEKATPAAGRTGSGPGTTALASDLDFATETPPPEERAAPAAAPPPGAAPAGGAPPEEPNLSAAARADAREQLRASQQQGAPAKRRSWIVPASAAAAFVIVFGGLFLARDGIVRRFPSTSGVYGALGMGGQPVLGAGLEFRDVSSSREWTGAEEVLVIQGLVANVLTNSATLLPVRVALYDNEDKELQVVTVPNQESRIKPGETVRFEARIANPSLSAQRIRVSFSMPAEPGGEKAS